MRFLLIIIAVLFLTPLAKAESMLTIDLAEDQVNITTGFNGARLALYGVKKQPGDIAIVIAGPQSEMVVRRKDQVAGLWINRESLRFRNVPLYYDLALSKPESRLAPGPTLMSYDIGLDALDYNTVSRNQEASKVNRFKEALIRNKQKDGHFPLEPEKIIFLDDNFFRANFEMPANVPTGEYVIKTFLFDDGEVVDINETQLRVTQVGFSAGLYRFAHLHSFFYSLLAIGFAVFAGLAAYFSLRRE